MGLSMVMGHVSDLRPIFKVASELLEFDDVGKQGSQYVFSQLFGEQEYQRSLSHDFSRPEPHWRDCLHSKLGQKDNNGGVAPQNIPLVPGKNYEFGIGLDYASAIFQPLNNSAEDIRSLIFPNPTILSSGSRSSTTPLQIPADLSISPKPFALHQVSAKDPSPPISQLDNLPSDNKTRGWENVPLVTNVIVPGSSVPAILSFRGEEGMLNRTWPKMWYQKYSCALMRQYIRSPQGPYTPKSHLSLFLNLKPNI